MKKLAATVLAGVLGVTGFSSTAFALGECGMACCLASAATSGVTLASKFGLAVQYEYMYMETLKEGTSEVSPMEVLNRKKAEWPMMPASTQQFSVPTEMTMEKYSLLATYPVTERFQMLAIIPYVRNHMDMKMVTRSTMGMDMVMDHKMAVVDGLGDITLMGLYTAYTDAPVKPTQRLTLGLGVKTPTGDNDERTSTGTLVHAMMQPGTGSWDPLFMVNYMRAFYPLVLQANLVYHMTTEGDKGYEFGDQISLDLIGRYQVANYVNIGLELNGIYAEKDDDHDGKYSRPETSLVDNVDNTGITSVMITPSVQVKIPGTGGSLEVKYQHPLYQNAEGIQQVVDWRVLATLVWNF